MNHPWSQGYAAVMDCISDSSLIAECPYSEGSQEEYQWQSGAAAAWEDECYYEEGRFGEDIEDEGEPS